MADESDEIGNSTLNTIDEGGVCLIFQKESISWKITSSVIINVTQIFMGK